MEIFKYNACNPQLTTLYIKTVNKLKKNSLNELTMWLISSALLSVVFIAAFVILVIIVSMYQGKPSDSGIDATIINLIIISSIAGPLMILNCIYCGYVYKKRKELFKKIDEVEEKRLKSQIRK